MPDVQKLESALPVAPLKLIAMKSAEKLGRRVNDYLVDSVPHIVMLRGEPPVSAEMGFGIGGVTPVNNHYASDIHFRCNGGNLANLVDDNLHGGNFLQPHRLFVYRGLL